MRLRAARHATAEEEPARTTTCGPISPNQATPNSLWGQDTLVAMLSAMDREFKQNPELEKRASARDGLEEVLVEVIVKGYGGTPQQARTQQDAVVRCCSIFTSHQMRYWIFLSPF